MSTLEATIEICRPRNLGYALISSMALGLEGAALMAPVARVFSPDFHPAILLPGFVAGLVAFSVGAVRAANTPQP